MDDVEVQVTAVLRREVVYEVEAELGMDAETIPLRTVWKDGEIDVAAVVEGLPEGSWGWFTQDRFEAIVPWDDVESGSVMMTSLPVEKSGTTFYGGREITRLEVLRMVRDQEEFRANARKAGKPLGGLPHGKDKRVLLVAVEKGDRIVLTRNLHYRELKPGDVIMEELPEELNGESLGD